jgi:hypothetical protein
MYPRTVQEVCRSRRMFASHRSINATPGHSELGGQVASRELKIVGTMRARHRAEELSDEVAAAIEKPSNLVGLQTVGHNCINSN